MPKIDKIIKVILDYYDFRNRILNESFFFHIKLFSRRRTLKHGKFKLKDLNSFCFQF